MAEKINLNTASKSDLDRIPGIGGQCAQAILDYREKKGKIESIDELGNLGGFGDKAMEHLRQSTTV